MQVGAHQAIGSRRGQRRGALLHQPLGGVAFGQLGLRLPQPRDACLSGGTRIRRTFEATTLRALVRYLVAICIGVAGTLAWQAYGKEAKQMIATRAPELGWSPEVRQTIASWTKPLAGPENTAARPAASESRQAAPVANTVPGTVAPNAPAVSSFDPEQAKQMAQSLDALLQAVERLAATQGQMTREMTRLQAADLEILAKIPAPPPQSPATPKRKPPAVPPQRAPTTALAPHR
jgi:hypothetical protein